MTEKAVGWKCQNCGLIVKEIKPWKKDECPEDVYDHEFVKITKEAKEKHG